MKAKAQSGPLEASQASDAAASTVVGRDERLERLVRLLARQAAAEHSGTALPALEDVI